MAFFKALMFAVLLQTVLSRSLNESIYMVTASSQMLGGTTETVCAHIQDATEAISLTVTLDPGTANITILTKAVSLNFYECVQFKVPTVGVDTVATLYVTVAGHDDSMVKESKILIKSTALITIIQTDKPIYKPGQNVLFRIVSLDYNFLPINRVVSMVELQDPNSNRIAQWLDRTPVSGILDLSNPMSPEAAQGSYTITAWNEEGSMASYTFDINEYVLPKYEVTVKLPNVITILDTEATLTVCGKYTYGKPVIGSVQAKMCRKVWQWVWYQEGDQHRFDICKTYELKTDPSGCAAQVVDVREFALNDTSYQDRFEVDAEMTEAGTGVVLTGSVTASFTDVIRAVTFENTPSLYRPGIVFKGEVKMTGPNSIPAANETVYLIVTMGSDVLENLTLTTDIQGVASFSLDSFWNESVSLKAQSSQSDDMEPYVPFQRRPSYLSAYLYLNIFYSESNSFVKVTPVDGEIKCNADAKVFAQYIIKGLEGPKKSLSFFYMVMSKGNVVQHGQLRVAVKKGTENKGFLSFSLKHVSDLAPVAQVVVYTLLPSGENVADSINFPIQPCLKNKVSLSFSSAQALPAEKTSLKLQAHPGSLCSLRAIDQSVLLLKKEAELSVDSVYRMLPVQKLDGYPYEAEDDDSYPCPYPVIIGKRRGPFFPFFETNDVYSMFKNIGIKVLTNSIVKKPNDCTRPYPIAMFAKGNSPEAFSSQGGSAVQDGATKETVRTYFPETWIWDLLPVGETGSVSIEEVVPDTITTWTAGAFCTSPAVGLGLAADLELTAFQPFFVSLTMPYSVVRGESFTLKATVFNYLDTCIMVKATLSQSMEFTSRECEGCQYTLCLCEEQSLTFSWIITPTSLGEMSLKVSAEALKTEDLCGNEVATVPEKGRIDTVIQPLLVEAEGTPVSVSNNALLCPADGPAEKNISLQLPENYVAGSAKAFISVLGDIMGRAMENVDSLLAMPYGCGEQNMILFAPDIYILNYLQGTRQLTKAILDKATVFLQSGYQKELTYKHSDGSYSAFGNSDESGNTWLTAFVMKSFGGARPFIYVDPRQINESRAWLFQQQRKDGCFNSVGKLIHTDLSGGVSDNITLTAYIAAALLELDADSINDPRVQLSLSCLRAAWSGQLNNTYTTALLFYTFSLAGDQETRTELLTYLDAKASTQGGTQHWDRPDAPSEGVDSLEVEMTAYVLLALFSGPTLPGFGLDYATPIVRWLIQQQNSYGGFASTQDTVVALQALAKYGTATFSPEGTTTVTVTSAGGLNKQYTVDQSNRLLYQEDPLSDVPGEYKVKAVGQSCVFVQISMHYNIPPPPDYSTFSIAVNTSLNCEVNNHQLVVFVRYVGVQEETNMVIINVKLLSGFSLNGDSLDLLKNKVKRVDLDDGYVNIYLDGMKKDQVEKFILTLQQDVVVSNLKPAVVKVYDYYQPNDQAVVDYIFSEC